MPGVAAGASDVFAPLGEESTVRQLALPLARIGVADTMYFAGSVAKLVEAWPAMVERLRQEEQEVQSTKPQMLTPEWDEQERRCPDRHTS